MKDNLETVVFGGGCFWCTEAVFQRLKGVEAVIPGYAGGHMDNPSYEQVSTGNTGHAEVVKISFDPKVISFYQLLDVFFSVHDPTTQDKQGHDEGPQYRSIILTTTKDQYRLADSYLHELSESGKFYQKLTTQIQELTDFYQAEEYHMDYYNNNHQQGYCRLVIDPKVKKLFNNYPELSRLI